MVLYYYLDSFKYVSLIIGFTDTFISIVISITVFFFILSNFVLSYLWETYTYKECLYFVLSIMFTANALILMSSFYKILFVI